MTSRNGVEPEHDVDLAQVELAHEVRQLFAELDEPGIAPPQSKAEAIALVRRAMLEQSPVPEPAKRRRVLPNARFRFAWLSVSALLFGGVAFAAWVGDVFPFGQGAPTPHQDAPKPDAKGSGSGVRRDGASESKAAVEALSGTGHETRPAAPRPQTSVESGEASHTARGTASTGSAASPDLLALANEQRRQRKVTEALRTYDTIIRQSPNSSAAYVARVASAQLIVSQRPSRAVQLLLAARRQNPNGPLDRELREALVRGYRNTGNEKLEAVELRALIRRTPSGSAAQQARERLKELESADE